MKKLLTSALLLALSCSLLTASPGLPPGRRASTPYDRYMAPVHRVLRSLNGQPPSFEKVAALTRKGYNFRYVYDEPYVAPLPQVTEARRAGDCKAKSLWLANAMNDPSVRYVIGKARRTSKISHAWLMWKYKGQWWILDPTNTPKPIPAASASPDEYIVFYTYDRNGSYKHQTPWRNRAVADQDAED